MSPFEKLNDGKRKKRRSAKNIRNTTNTARRETIRTRKRTKKTESRINIARRGTQGDVEVGVRNEILVVDGTDVLQSYKELDSE
ncbi:uncharacterized protein PITG_21495 [Phytophthora infestans T30-4]|uniref:Uncharacterized protein n=1 Tax=Phytophthora infestans (strain T30-4) TaxID=403677 RepID=D0P4C2_PHYIT|nr:uncharacterized protein PITG_21495 [Phytophthora infestans T30-4]EEY64746.1 hypothetical protein PITG_21495 [Phytophthora infestans T30-4]|eukprot:XP_002894853.1 hypothetical protein PITG_21495 [Phytophthora infestans T30-4]